MKCVEEVAIHTGCDVMIITCPLSLYRESKRKTAAIVSMRNDERLFGDAALSTVS